jgi:putative transposase
VYEFIDGEKAVFSIVMMCQVLEVSRSEYYVWRDAAASATVARRVVLLEAATEIYHRNDGRYGYRRIHQILLRQGHQCGPELVRDLLKQAGLRGWTPKKWQVTTRPDKKAAAEVPDLVRRDFTADTAGAKLVGDITYVYTWEGWVYLATVIDCYSRAVVGWAVADHMRTELVTDAIAMAARNIRIPRKAVFHSDRGSQYMSFEYRKVLKANGLRSSVGRTGVCWDNALAESFNASLKNEMVNRTHFPTKALARDAIVRYVEVYYNRQRIHSALQYRTPFEVLSGRTNYALSA